MLWHIATDDKKRPVDFGSIGLFLCINTMEKYPKNLTFSALFSNYT